MEDNMSSEEELSMPSRDMPLQSKKPMILNIVDKLDMQRRFTGGPDQVNSSRSNSIKGKKLSLCDPQLTISQHTVDKVQESQTQRDTLQRLSSAAQNYPMTSLPNETSSFVVEKECKDAKTRRGNHNPRQSKEKLPKKKIKKSRDSNHQSAQLNAYIRLQHAIRPHMPAANRPLSSLSRLSAQNQSTDNNQSAISKERKSMQHSHSQGSINTVSRKQLLSRAKLVNGAPKTGFQLTFNNKRSPNRKPSGYVVQRKQGNLGVEQVQRPQTSLGLKSENIAKRVEGDCKRDRSASSNRSKLQTIKEVRPKSTSPSPQKKSFADYKQPSSNSKRQSHSAGKSSFSNGGAPTRRRDNSASENKTERHSSTSIDHLIRENIKRQQEKNKEQAKKAEQDKEEDKTRRKELADKNKLIREQNFKKLALSKLQKIKTELAEHVSEAPKRPRNMDAPLPMKDREIQLQKKRQEYDLGLEIFQLKRELGLASNRDHRQSRHEAEVKPRSVSAEKSRGSSSRKRKQLDMKKVIAQHQKQWLKKIKKQQVTELMLQQKVINNLKQLNEVIDSKRHSKRPEKKGSLFKTVDENKLQKVPSQSVIVQGKKKKLPKKSIVNIQLEGGQANIENFNINGALSTKDRSFHQAAKKPAKVRITTPDRVQDRPQTAPKAVVVEEIKARKSERSHKQTNRSSSDGHTSSKTKAKKPRRDDQLIKQLLERIELQQQQIDELKHNVLQSARKEPYSSEQRPPVPQISPEKPPERDQRVVIEDDMMIFCVLSTAASIIQRKFREYLSRKKRKQQALTESLKIEDRLKPVVKEAKPQRRRPDQKKQAKHTFSFGEEQKQVAPPPPKRQEDVKRVDAEVSSLTLDLDTQRGPEKPSDQVTPVNDPEPQPSSSQEVDQVLKINDKFKFALRNIAEKQKQSNVLVEVLSKRKRDVKPAPKRFFIKDDDSLSLINKADLSKNSERRFIGDKQEESILSKELPTERIMEEEIPMDSDLVNEVERDITLNEESSILQNIEVQQSSSSIEPIVISQATLKTRDIEDEQLLVIPVTQPSRYLSQPEQPAARPHLFDYHSQLPEKLLFENEYSPQSSMYMLNTNASVFERNPFHDLTTGKLQELLQSKSLGEVQKIRQDAVKYQERVEKGYINRLQDRNELSPSSAKRRRFELERWVSVEARKDPAGKDIEDERREATEIIMRVNQKVRDIKREIIPSEKGSSRTSSHLSAAIEEARNHQNHELFNKPSIQQHVEEVKEELSVVELSLEDDSKPQAKVEITPKKQPMPLEDEPALVLEISMEDEEQEYQTRVDQAQVDELCESIMLDFLASELASFDHLRRQALPEKANFIEQPPVVEEEKQREPEKQQQISLGIDTTDEAIDAYIEEIFDQIRPRKEMFLQAFITPIYKNPLEVLANIQKPDFGGQGQGEDGAPSLLEATNSLAYILNVQLYLTLEKAKENIIHETIEQIRRQQLLSNEAPIDEEMTDMMSEAQHIHNKVVFDCVNESLNMVRPYGSQGEPMPWSRKPRKNLIFLFDYAEDLDSILLQVKNTVVNWSRHKAGALAKPKPLHSRQGKSSEFEDPLLAEQRHRALQALLSQEVLQQEERWLDFETEETQVKVDLSDIVLEHLVGETVDILNAIQQSRS